MDYIEHSAKGSTWTKKNHKYIRKEGNRYIYPPSGTARDILSKQGVSRVRYDTTYNYDPKGRNRYINLANGEIERGYEDRVRSEYRRSESGKGHVVLNNNRSKQANKLLSDKAKREGTYQYLPVKYETDPKEKESEYYLVRQYKKHHKGMKAVNRILNKGK